jgi:hypothetical protein
MRVIMAAGGTELSTKLRHESSGRHDTRGSYDTLRRLGAREAAHGISGQGP